MVVFENLDFPKLKQDSKVITTVQPLILPNEDVIDGFSSGSKGVVFTTLRAILLTPQGRGGKRDDFTSIHYRKLTSYSLDTGGRFDKDFELHLYLQGMEPIRFDFRSKFDVTRLVQHITNSIR